MAIDKKVVPKIPINVSVNLTKTQLATIRTLTGLTSRKNSNEIVVKALISNVANKKIRLWN